MLFRTALHESGSSAIQMLCGKVTPFLPIDPILMGGKKVLFFDLPTPISAFPTYIYMCRDIHSYRHMGTTPHVKESRLSIQTFIECKAELRGSADKRKRDSKYVGVSEGATLHLATLR